MLYCIWNAIIDQQKKKKKKKAYILNNYCFNYLRNSNKLIYALILLYATLITEACNHMKDCCCTTFFVAITKKLIVIDDPETELCFCNGQYLTQYYKKTRSTQC